MPNIDTLDLAAGIPSYNEADNIGFVVRQVAAGLEKYFPDLNTVIINADNFSQDGTKDAFIAADSGRIPKVYLSTPAGVKGKGNNFRNLFNYLLPYHPKAVVVVDADLRSIRPEWVRYLGRTVFKGFDFVTPPSIAAMNMTAPSPTSCAIRSFTVCWAVIFDNLSVETSPFPEDCWSTG